MTESTPTRFFVNTSDTPTTVEIQEGFTTTLPPRISVEIDEDVAQALIDHDEFLELTSPEEWAEHVGPKPPPAPAPRIPRHPAALPFPTGGFPFNEEG